MKKYNIIWKGNKHTNRSSRRGHAPYIIVNHISEGTAASAISWFTSSGNKASSAHFLVSKTGQIYQFVKIEDNAWANGLSSSDLQTSTASIVREKGVNPNWYSVSIEHEGVFSQTKGQLTSEQLEATIWLHRYIIDYIKEKWDIDVPINREHILGHSQIDPIRKPLCPGGEYPFNRIIENLKNEPSIAFADILGHWAEDYIIRAVKEGILTGYPDGLFKPNQNVTRAELAAVIVRLLNKGE